ncbi:hypothetical protein HOY80DRAFT_907035 [Tuber brumale]|nr:hypothetical protein HOY80DRAFT_907035 [Tuber brumale]
MGLLHFARTVPMEHRKDRRRAGWTARTRPYSRVRDPSAVLGYGIVALRGHGIPSRGNINNPVIGHYLSPEYRYAYFNVRLTRGEG